MGATDNGDQLVFFDYKQPASAESFNKVMKDAIEPGVYNGGILTDVGADNITVSPFIIFIEDTDALRIIRIKGQTNATVNANGEGDDVTPAYLYCTYTWINTELNYLDFAFRATTDSPIAGELILGTVFFTAGGNIDTVSQAGQTAPTVTANSFTLTIPAGSGGVIGGDIVRLEASSGKVIPGKADLEENVKGILGVASNTALENANVLVITIGEAVVTTSDTWTAADIGKIVYLSETNLGEATKNIPVNEDEYVSRIGHIKDGVGKVITIDLDYPLKITTPGPAGVVNAAALQGNDISTDTPNDGDHIYWDDGLSEFKFEQPPVGGGEVTQVELDELYRYVVMGAVPGWDFSVVVGGGSAEEPDQIIWTDTVSGDIIRISMTYGTFGPTIALYELSLAGTGPYGSLGTETTTYDGSGNVTAIIWS